METFSMLLAICVGNSPVNGEFPAQRPVTRSFDVSLIWAWINDWVNNHEAGDLRRHHAHYDVTMMSFTELHHGFQWALNLANRGLNSLVKEATGIYMKSLSSASGQTAQYQNISTKDTWIFMLHIGCLMTLFSRKMYMDMIKRDKKSQQCQLVTQNFFMQSARNMKNKIDGEECETFANLSSKWYFG